MTVLLRSFLAPYKGPLAAVIALLVVQAFGNLYLPDLFAQIINNGVVTGDTGYILQRGSVMLGVTLAVGVASIVAVYFSARTAMAFGRDVRGSLFRTVQGFSHREVNAFGTHSLITRNTNDVQQIQMFLMMALTVMVAAPIMAIGGIVMAVRMDATLAWLLVIVIPVMAIVIGAIVSRAIPQFRSMQSKIDTVNRVMREQLTGIRVIRAFVRTSSEQRRFAAANADLTATALTVNRLFALMMPALMLIMNLSSVAIIWFGGLRVDSGEMPIGNLTAFLTYMTQILFAVMMATMMFVMVPRAAASAERVRAVLDVTPELSDPAVPRSPGRHLPAGRVELRGAEFRYPGAEASVLVDVTLTAEPGQTTAVVGSTGSGKSTLVNLIPRLYDVTGGSVLVDGVDVREMSRLDLWSRIGLVPQRAFLFGGTVASNLRVGRSDASDEDLWAALEVAQAADFVRALPGGPQRARRPGRSQLLRRSAAAAGDRPRDRAQPGRVRLRRQLLRARLRHRCSAARRPATANLTGDRHRGRPAGGHDHACRPHRGARRRTAGRFRQAPRADGHLRDLSGDRPVPADRGGGDVSDSRPRPPVRGPLGGGPMSGLAMPVEKPQSFGPTVRRLGRRLEPERPWLLSVLALASVSVALAVLGPKLLGDATTLIYDGVVGGSGVDVAALAQQAALVAMVYLFSSLFAWAQAYLVAGIVQRAMYALREDVETTLGRLPLRYFDSSERGDLLSRVTNDLDNISTTMQQIAAQLVNSVLTVVGVLVMMFWISPLLAVISLLTVPLSFVVTMAIARRSQPHFVTQWRTTGLLNSHVEETYTGHDLVKVFGMQDRVVADFDEVNEQVFQSSFRAQFISGIIQPAMHFVGNLNYVLICVVGGVRVANGTMPIGDVQAFIQYSRQFTMPITQIASVVNLMQSGVASTERVFAVLDATPEKPDPIAPARVGPVRGRVTLEGVSFRYRPDRPLIDDLDLVVEPGETIAIVGPTGAGKTTLVNLLMRFYDIDAGRITLDGVDTATMTRDDVRRSFAMVLQDTWLFGGTIRDNIAYGADAGDAGQGRSWPRRAGDLCGCPGGVRGPLRAHAARRVRHRARRGRLQPLRRREAAHDDRAGVPRRPACPHPRRGDELGGHPHRGADPAGHGRAAAGPDQLRHRPPAVHDP